MAKKVYKYETPTFIEHPRAIARFEDVLATLKERRPITKGDATLLDALAHNLEIFWVYSDDIRKNGATQINVKGEEVKRPVVGLAKDAEKAVREILIEFGLTDKSASKVGVKASDDKEPAPLRKFVK